MIIEYNVQLNKLFNMLKLGGFITEPAALSGGLLHKIYKVETEQGCYAVKALNPQIMLRPKAMGDYINSENISLQAAEKISAVPALRFNGGAVQELEGQHYLIYNFIEGKNLPQNEITAEHCEAIGDMLARLHKIDFSKPGLKDEYSFKEDIADWDGYLARGIESGALWVDIMQENIGEIKCLEKMVGQASGELSEETVISHGDLESKNVLWSGGKPYIIDWESAGFIHPVYDLVETAIYWSVDLNEDIDVDLFKTFIQAYMNRNKIENPNWLAALHKSYQNKLGWLNYSFKRSLGIEAASQKDNDTGTEHVFGTIKSLRRHSKNVEKAFKLLRVE